MLVLEKAEHMAKTSKKPIGYKLVWFKESDLIPADSEYIDSKQGSGNQIIYLFKIPVYEE